jgi:hypothetical protein
MALVCSLAFPASRRPAASSPPAPAPTCHVSNVSDGRQWNYMSTGIGSAARKGITRRFGLIVTGTIAVVVPAPPAPAHLPR